jgi:hypothetical protein
MSRLDGSLPISNLPTAPVAAVAGFLLGVQRTAGRFKVKPCRDAAEFAMRDLPANGLGTLVGQLNSLNSIATKNRGGKQAFSSLKNSPRNNSQIRGIECCV